jgi:protein translocase SecG subunit
MTPLKILQLITALILVALILLQSPEGGLSTKKGSFHTRQGLEKVILYLTIAFGSIFLILSIFALL